MKEQQISEAVTAIIQRGDEPQQSQAAVVDLFWKAVPEAMFDQKVVAPVIGYSEGWCEKARLGGYGPKYRKNRRRVLYKKSDVLAFINGMQSARSTADYAAPA